VGPALAHFIAKHEVLKAMNADTKAQLKLALDLAKLAEDEEDSPGKTLFNLIVQCLKRDQNWKQYYNENVRNKKSHSASESNYRLNMAEAEREAFQLALRNSCRDAVESIRKAIDSNALDENEKGFYLQKVANYMYEVEPGESLQIQLSAHEKNDSMFCPPGIVRKPYMPGKFNDQTTILQWFKNFGNPNGAIAAIEDLRSRLSYDADPSTIEQAIMELAPLIGANGSRPEQEHGEGPDDLWLWSSIGLVIEAKNQNEKTLHKKDAGQLLLSLEWFKRSYSGRDTGIPVIIAKVAIADRKAGFPDKTRVVTSSKMQALLDKLEMFYQALASEPPLFLVEKKIAEFQAKFQLLPEQFIKRYTVPIEESKK
jgi:hypothetical protein